MSHESDTPDQAELRSPTEFRSLSMVDPFKWLVRGSQDFARAPGIGLFFGACFVGMGWALLIAFKNAPALLLGLSAGFLLMGPFLCMGLYHVSACLERGEKPGLENAILAWQHQLGAMAIFGMVLLVLEMLWARASLLVFALAMEGPMPDFAGSLRNLVNPNNLEFVLGWIAVGGVFASIIFAMCVISIPMILDRGTDAISASLTSIQLVLSQTGVMLLWAALISILVFVAMLPGFAGLLVVGPVLGHASWHAYRAAMT